MLKSQGGSFNRRQAFAVGAVGAFAAALPGVQAAGITNLAPISGDGLNLPARMIPVPSDVSPEAQSWLTTMGRLRYEPPPPLSDQRAWKEKIAKDNPGFGAFRGLRHNTDWRWLGD